VGLIALEEYGIDCPSSNAVNFTLVAGCDKDVTGTVEREVPDVFRPWIEIQRKISSWDRL
jgi:hypothetical protein